MLKRLVRICRGHLAARPARPLHGLELRGHFRVGIARAVDHDRQQKCFLLRHRLRALRAEFPFQPKISLQSRLRVRGDQRYEQGARTHLPANLGVPLVSADEFALIKPNFDPRRAQRITNPFRRLDIFRGVTEEDRLAREFGHGQWKRKSEGGKLRESGKTQRPLASS